MRARRARIRSSRSLESTDASCCSIVTSCVAKKTCPPAPTVDRFEDNYFSIIVQNSFCSFLFGARWLRGGSFSPPFRPPRPPPVLDRTLHRRRPTSLSSPPPVFDLSINRHLQRDSPFPLRSRPASEGWSSPTASTAASRCVAAPAPRRDVPCAGAIEGARVPLSPAGWREYRPRTTPGARQGSVSSGGRTHAALGPTHRGAMHHALCSVHCAPCAMRHAPCAMRPRA